MNVEEIRINQLIEVSVDEDDSEYHGLASRIEGIERDSFHISVPTHRGNVLPLSLGTRLIISVIHRGDVYRFGSVVIGRKRDPIPMLTIRKPESLSKIQRRHWVRLAAVVDIYYYVDDGTQISEEYRGQSIDISGGGLLLLTTHELVAGYHLMMRLDVPGQESVLCKGQVLRTINEASTGKNYQKAAVEFYEISERSRDRIIKFIFDKQREWIRRGVIKS